MGGGIIVLTLKQPTKEASSQRTLEPSSTTNTLSANKEKEHELHKADSITKSNERMEIAKERDCWANPRK